MINPYHNPWIPAEALRILESHHGTILDVGGGAAPYDRADHIVDILPFDACRTERNQWGNSPSRREWTTEQYTQFDLCGGKAWPFSDKHFDLGLCSHCLEDLRDPIPVVAELSRVCRRVLVICPSRLLEQTRGIDHPAYCGFYHHPWMVFEEGGRIMFRRKTSILELKNCHVVCPIGWTLRPEVGSMFVEGENLHAEEGAFWSEDKDYRDYVEFIRPYLARRDLFIPDGRKHGVLFRVWRLRQKYFGRL